METVLDLRKSEKNKGLEMMEQYILKGWNEFLEDEKKYHLNNKSQEKIQTYWNYAAGKLNPEEIKKAEEEFNEIINHDTEYYNNPEEEREEALIHKTPVREKENLVRKFIVIKHYYAPLATVKYILEVLVKNKKISERGNHYSIFNGGQ